MTSRQVKYNNKPFSHQLKYSLTHIPLTLGGYPHFLCFRVYPQMADIWGSFLVSLVAAETEAAAADLWRVVVEKGIVQPEVIPQHVGTLRGAAWLPVDDPGCTGC